MDTVLTEFWGKYPKDGKLSEALHMVYDHVCWAKEKLEAEDEEYKHNMSKAYVMLEEILREMGIDPYTY